jgi:hypothetical protein
MVAESLALPAAGRQQGQRAAARSPRVPSLRFCNVDGVVMGKRRSHFVSPKNLLAL